MSKIKVQDLAARFKLNPAQLLKDLKQAGFKVGTHLASVNEAKATQAIEEIYGAPEGAEANRVLIKKYENRRLYSTTASRHLTLEEVAELVRGGRAIHVVDATTNRDITSEILTQILLEGGRAGRLPVAFLEKLIRLQDEALQTFFDRFLNQGMQMYFNTQKEMARFYQNLASPRAWPMAGSWMAAFGLENPEGAPQKSEEAVAENLKMTDTVGPGEARANRQSEPQRAESPAEELRVLQERLRDLEERIGTADFARAKTLNSRKRSVKKK